MEIIHTYYLVTGNPIINTLKKIETICLTRTNQTDPRGYKDNVRWT